MADLEAFRNQVISYLRQAVIESKAKKDKEKRGATLTDLASYCNYSRSELSRKLHRRSKMPSEVVQQIIKALAEWEAITTKGQAKELLTLMDVSDFSPADWNAFPLKLLETEGEGMELDATIHHAAEQKRPREKLEQPRKDIVALPITDDLLHEENEEGPELSRSLTTHRWSKGWTQADLSEKSQVPVRAIQRIEAGIIKSPNSETLQRLANAFGIDVMVFKEAYCDGIASDTVQTVDRPPNNDTTATSIPRDPTEATGPSRNKWKLISKDVFYLFIVSSLMFAIYALIINPRIQSNKVKPVLISGKVLCAKSEPVVNIWVDVFKGSNVDKGISGYADLRTPNSNGSEVAFVYVLKGDAYNLHVGCGGSKQHWKGVYITEIGSGPVHDHKFHYFICHDVPPAIDYGSCEFQY